MAELEPLAVVLERAKVAAEARRERILTELGHVHGPQCTADVCGETAYEHDPAGPCPITAVTCHGHMLPWRADLVAQSRAARGLSDDDG